MTKKELISHLVGSEVKLDEEMLVSAVYKENEGDVPILVPIDYVFGQFINVTIV